MVDMVWSLQGARYARPSCLRLDPTLASSRRGCQGLTVILSVPGPWPSDSFSASTRAAAILLTSVCMRE